MAVLEDREWPTHVRVAVIGTGFGGLGAGVRLAEAGISDFVILERAAAVGGTWRDNTYPGCACDVPSHLYSFSFAPNPNWTHSFSRQPEIRAYLEGIAEQYRLRHHIRFGAEVTEARWDPAHDRWRLHTTRGALSADVVISAAGPLSDPSLPDLPGLDEFPGAAFHSARWDHGYSLDGARVAVIGTGASAVQIVPEVQRQAAQLVVFQRTPAWVIPRMDREFTRAERWLYHFPAAQRLARFGIYASREAYVPAFTKQPRLLKGVQQLALLHLARGVPDPVLRAKLTPDYVLGCKRVLVSNDFYPALAQPNVEVVASGLARIDGPTLIAQDGSARDVDAIVFATGFHAVDMPIAERVFGADGRSLAESWDGDMAALRGTTIAGFPNLCLVIGPNTGLGHTSMVHIIESQLAYIIDYVRALDRRGVAGLDARPEAQERWCADIQRRMTRTVWATGGCKSWYLNAAGRNTTLWPGTTVRFRRSTRRVDAREYRPIESGPAGKRGALAYDRPPVPNSAVRVASTDGVSLHGEIYGRHDAPTVVLVHGWANSTRVWGPLIRALGDDVRVVAYDQRGHGASDVPGPGRYSTEALVDDLAAVLEATVPAGEKAVLVGHSMGGMTIMAAGQRPSVVQRAAGAVLASTGYGDLVNSARVIPARSARVAAVVQRQILRSSAPMGPVSPLSRAALRYGTLGPGSAKELAVLNAELVHACGRRTRGAWGRVLDSLDVGDAVGGLDVPVHVVVGTADRMTPPPHAQRIAERLPHCVGVTELAGVGHMTPLEAPQALAELVLKLIVTTREPV